MTTYMWLSMGLGGDITDPMTNAASMVQQAKALGIDTRESPYNYFDEMKISMEIEGIKAKTPKAKIIVGGASYGDNAVLQVANLLVFRKIDIDLAFGFQRSLKGPTLRVPSNVIKGIEIYDPDIITDKYGADPWVLAPGNTRTQLQNIPIIAQHPGDFGEGQAIIMEAIKLVVV